ncbi:hypothetical protein [Nocardia yamanashiensis]|uniref:hypothetical protein n=1 Tax=Nocardia yamanashiensis TaxID=209247 RepID=UPI000A92D8DF|nr:hypothetical protein [Nocardia yamanashiensis]
MSQVIKVFTPVKRVPTMIGKAQNGQRLPFGPYTLPQIAAAAVMLLVTAVCSMNLPANPAVTFVTGAILTAIVVFSLGLVPYTGVRLTSRAMWLTRLLILRKPASASGMPVDIDTARNLLFVEESVVVVMPSTTRQSKPAAGAKPVLALGDIPALLASKRG